MKRTILLTMLFLLTFGGAPVAGAPILGTDGDDLACSYEKVAEYLRTTADHYVPGNRSVVDETILLVRLENSLSIGDRVIFEVLQDGERRLLEEVMVKVDDLAIALDFAAPALDGPVLELLGAEPGLRAHLQAQAAAGADLRVTVHVNGRTVAERAFADIAAASGKLRTDGPQPLAIERWGEGSRATRSVSRGDGSFLPTKSCEANCDAVVDLCYDDCVFTPGGGSCFAACDAEFDDCLASCGGGGGGGCTPGSASTTEDSVVSRTLVGPIRCLRYPIFNTYDDYIRVRERNRRVTTTTTTLANCSQTTNSTTTFFNTFCWQLNSFGCNAPFSVQFFCPM